MIKKQSSHNRVVPRSAIVDSLKSEIRRRSVHHADSETRISSTKGNKQNWLIDLRPILLDPDVLQKICDIFWTHYEAQLPFQVGGMEVAAVPIVTALVLTGRQRGLDVSGFIIRKERKRSGLSKRIEGEITDRPIVLVDDILNNPSYG